MKAIAIIVAAGMGRRLSPHTDDRPKCLVEIAGRPLLLRQLEAYRRAGVSEFVIVRGYRADQLTAALAGEPGVRFIDNFDYQKNNILESAMCAAGAMDGAFFFSYSDIVFRPEIVTGLREGSAAGALRLVIDPFWEEAYDGRTDHPVSEAELAEVRAGVVRRVGKRVVPREEAHGEFIGLLYASPEGAAALRSTYLQRRRELFPDQPYGRAPRFQVAYLTDLLNDLIAQGVTMTASDIQRPTSWREIDTVQDLERARAVVDW